MSESVERLDDSNATPLRPEPGTEPPWYRPDRDLAHIGMQMLKNAIQLLPPEDTRTALGAGAVKLGVGLDESCKGADVLGRSVQEWFKLTNGQLVQRSPGTAKDAPQLVAAHTTYDSAMGAGGWYDLPKTTRFVIHAALGEIMLPVIFHHVRSECRIGENIPTPEQVAATVGKARKHERSVWQWLIRRCRTYYVRLRLRLTV